MSSTNEREEIQRRKDAAMDVLINESYYNREKRAKRRRNVRAGFLICLAILVLASVLNWGVVTGWGNVDIDRINIVGADGAEYSALVYIPANATDETPAPAIIMFHGNAGNARNHESWAVEMARRGFVVLAADLYGSGDSQGYFDGSAIGALSGESLLQEADTFFQYLVNMSIVDTDNIVSSGHSMGGTASGYLGAKYGAKLVFGASPAISSEAGEDALSQENVQYWLDYTGNFVITMGEYENLQALEDGQSELDKRGIDDTFETDKVFGSFEEGNGYAFLVEHRIHEAAFVDQTAIGHLIEYSQLSIGDAVPNYIDASDQVWMYKDYTGLLCIFAFAAFICALALLLIEEVEVFGYVRRPVAANKGLRGRGLALSIALAIIFPYIVLKTDAFGIIGGRFYNNLRSAGFNMGYSNMAFGTVVGISLLGILGLLLYYFTDGKKLGFRFSEDAGLTPADYSTAGNKPLAVAKYVLTTMLLAAVVVAVAWGYVALQEEVFGTSFYAWFFGVKEIPISKIPYYLNYLVIWILCFVVSALGLNVERRLPTTGNETRDLVIQIFFNVVTTIFTITLIVAVKWVLQTEGSAADTNLIWSMGVDTQRIWGMPVGMTVASAGNTFLYRKTGNAWLSAILMGTVACLMCVLFGGTRFHYLTFYV